MTAKYYVIDNRKSEELMGFTFITPAAGPIREATPEEVALIETAESNSKEGK